MKVLYQSRINLLTDPGGDTVQVLKTREHLEKRGVEIDISTDLTPDLASYDLVHLFNIMRPQETFLQACNARKQGKKVVLSTIYGLYSDYEREARGGVLQWVNRLLPHAVIEYLKIFARVVKNGEFHRGTRAVLRRGFYQTMVASTRRVDMFLPNSLAEMKRVQADFGLSDPPYQVIPNAVDKRLFDYDRVELDRDFFDQYRDCVLCVARIDGRKNQLNLIRALENTPYQLVIIGQPSPNHQAYYRKVRRAVGPRVVLAGQVPHDRLPGFYKAARVHVLPSWMDTPGLSSLEAGIMKCNLVVTRKGDPYSYFGEEAYYCEPDDVESIRKAVIRAYEDPFRERLRERILREYTWDVTADKTLAAYRRILDPQPRKP